MSTPVKQVRGIGPKTAEYLIKQNIQTAEQLIEFGVTNLGLAPGFSAARAETVIEAAKELLGVAEATSLAITFATPEASITSRKSAKDKKKDKGKKDKKKNKKDKKDKKDKKKDKKKNRKDKKKNK